MTIAFILNQLATNFHPSQPETAGGGENALMELARSFIRLGHSVTVFWQGGQPYTDSVGVQYLHYSTMASRHGTFDLAIYRKTPEYLPMGKLAPRNFYWADQVSPFEPNGFERVIVASDFLMRILAQMTPACAHLLTKINEGTNFSLFPEEPIHREPQVVLYSSSPDRGLRDLLTVWPTVLETHPNATLLVSYGFDKFDSCGGPVSLKNEILALAAQTKQVKFLGNITEPEMFKLYSSVGVWAYPCHSGEHFCHSAVRAQLGGAIPVVIPWGALKETVWSGYSADTLAEFTTKLVHALHPENQIRVKQRLHGRDLEMALAHEDKLPMLSNWDDVAKQWVEQVFDVTTPVVPADGAEASFLRSVPGSPPFDTPLAATVAPRLWPLLAQWLESLTCQKPYIDPSLGIAVNIPSGPITQPNEGDAVILGYQLEDAKDNPRQVIEAMGLKDGVPVAVIASHGNYRQGLRQRVFDRRAMAELFEHQPNLVLRTMPLDNEGNALSVAFFNLNFEKLGNRNIARVLRTLAPRETLSVCMITRDAGDTIGTTLRALIGIADEVCILDNGSTDNTLDEVSRFAKSSGVPTKVQENGYCPRYCFNCLRIHDQGELAHGHQVAGFETPRNQSLAMASGDWCLWIDADETLTNGKAIAKYLRNNIFEGYCVQQHHFSVDPPQAMKVDLPVRIFRRKVDPVNPTPGIIPYGDLQWPTYHSGLTVRFGGIVHEHPGFGPTYGEGLGPVIILSDVWIAHSGYLTESARRKRFVRNWPLMVADRQKYPERRLGKFLWIRDLCHQARYALEQSGGKRTPEIDALANEAVAMWRRHFVDSNDPFAPDALQYAKAMMQILGRGVDTSFTFRASKPEVSGDEKIEWSIDGRFENKEQILKLISARLGELERWDGDYL